MPQDLVTDQTKSIAGRQGEKFNPDFGLTEGPMVFHTSSVSGSTWISISQYRKSIGCFQLA
jgi:hypothetical protein